VTGVRWLLGMAVLLLVASMTPAVSDGDPSAGTPAGPRPAQPWQPGRPQLGVQVYWVDVPTDTPEVLRRKAQRVLDHIVGLESNSVSISFPFYTRTITSSAVVTDHRTPSPERLAAVVDEAQRSGLRVTIRPLLDEQNLMDIDSRNWRGLLDPADRDAWFVSYREFLTPYLRVAQQQRVQTVVLGAELNMLQSDRRWAELVEYARGIYGGELGYAANWDAYTSAAVSIPVDTVGIDAYPRLGLPPTASAAEMELAWRNWLRQAVPAGQAAVPLYELGAAAEARTLDNPAVPHRTGARLDEGVQNRWLGAACAAARDHGLAGVYLWKIELDVDPALADPVNDLHDSWLGRAAETTMRQCFAEWPAK
jgi:hypothetical protein